MLGHLILTHFALHQNIMGTLKVNTINTIPCPLQAIARSKLVARAHEN